MLLERSSAWHGLTCLTLTAIHPDSNHWTPSRHILLGDTVTLADALERLYTVNQQGWGAYLAIGLRKPGLGRYQRGGIADVVALPALFVDVDDLTQAALLRLRQLSPPPSCLIFTGGGYHAYWWLQEPTTDLANAQLILQALATASDGDPLSVAQSMRLPGSLNVKHARNHVRCQLIELHDRYYCLTDFQHLFAQLLPPSPVRRFRLVSQDPMGAKQYRRPNPELLTIVTNCLLQKGFTCYGDWLNGPCFYSQHHQHDDRHPSFGFNTRTGYGHCFRCGIFLLKDICLALGIDFTAYGSFYHKL